MQPLKILAVLAGAFFASLLAAAVFLFATAVVTSGWGGGRTGNAMVMMLAADGILFLLATLGVFLGLKKFVDSQPVRILLTLGYGLAMAVTLVLLTLFSAVFFNR